MCRTVLMCQMIGAGVRTFNVPLHRTGTKTETETAASHEPPA